ncbi:MAG: AAA family ATPase [Prevotella sp.]|nr:AAA family ATPase [Prevotella sp.]
MTSTEFVKLVEQQFGYEPTAEQHGALECFAAFMADRSDRSLMILRGSAGTGKTTLAGALIGVLGRLGVKTVLLAPTGRAAKVFSLNSGQSASTIHRKIYRRKSVEGGFSLAFNAHSNTLFLVDEASMISGVGGGLGMFGTNSLLDDLMSFVYEGRHCRLLLIGDPAQLPPVGENEAPALDGEVMRGYGMTVYEADMSEVMRQSQDSGILWNATKIRNFDGFEVGDSLLPTIQFKGFADIRIVRGDELIESLASSYSAVGMDETIVVTRSNKRANAYNTGIRNTILGREEELTTGDLLMVVRNKYLKSGVKELGSEGVKKNEDGVGRSEETELDFIANGDHAVVCRVRNIHEMHGFRFADVLLRFPDYDDAELQSMVLLDTLQSEAPALTAEQSRQLYDRVLADYADVKPKSKRLKQVMEDVYYSALQVKYGYAVTCHKAQGGQWAHVYVDQGYVTEEMLTPDYIHWLYTAFTRATNRLFLVNWPKNQVEAE